MIEVLTVAEIRIYPVKAMRGVSVPSADVEPWGLGGDRRWMVVDAAGRFLTQRELPKMAIVRAALDAHGLELSAGGLGVLSVPMPSPGADTVETTIFKDRVRAVRADPSADVWLTRALGVACHLVFLADPAIARPVDPAYASPDDRVSFADGFPLLLTATASLADLNRRLAEAVPMDRFRPNVVVGGPGAAWGEDHWHRLRIGAVAFSAPKDCARCAVPTVDQDTGVKAESNEPLRTLGRFRRQADGRITFGQNLIPASRGRIAVGDIVEVLA